MFQVSRNVMRSAAALGVVAGALLMGASVAGAQTATKLTMKFQPEQRGYLRGDHLNVWSQLRTSRNEPIANATVAFSQWDAQHPKPHVLGTVQTDAKGIALKDVKVPEDASRDWVFVGVTYQGDADAGFNAARSIQKRIPIGPRR